MCCQKCRKTHQLKFKACLWSAKIYITFFLLSVGYFFFLKSRINKLLCVCIYIYVYFMSKVFIWLVIFEMSFCWKICCCLIFSCSPWMRRSDATLEGNDALRSCIKSWSYSGKMKTGQGSSQLGFPVAVFNLWKSPVDSNHVWLRFLLSVRGYCDKRVLAFFCSSFE